MTRQTKQVPPDTQRVVEGFRDTGYTFNSAIADIIDNAITANATVVSVMLDLDPYGEPHVWVGDDGDGMDLAGLENAMRYGSRRRSDRHSLSRFGLGLKTASTSFCRRLTVVSRSGSNDAYSATWDIDLIAETGEWLLDTGSATDDETAALAECLSPAFSSPPSHGTLVSWEKVDRLLKTKAGNEAKNKPLILKRMRDDLALHLRMVFQRYMDPSDKRAGDVRLFLNSEELAPWDPFCETRGGEMVKAEQWDFVADGETESVRLRAFILPRKEEFATEEDRSYARISNDLQGIYLYREDRMIEGPNWLGMSGGDTHLNNLRVELSFSAPLDEVFGVGIRKSGVHVDRSLLEELDDILAPVRREANRRSRKGSVKPSPTPSASNPTENTIARNLKSLDVATVKSEADGSTVLENNSGTPIPLLDSSGHALDYVRVLADQGDEDMNVVRRNTLEDGVLWQPSLGNGRIQVAVNTGHDWYRKAYVPNEENSPLAQAIDYLLYALAQAEMNNTDNSMWDMFEEYRVEVSRNLRKLVKDLPEPDDE